MFLGREKELSELSEVMSQPGASVMIYGNRRVGKTTLILEAAKKSPDRTIYYECSPAPMEENAERFMRKLNSMGMGPQLAAKGFDEVTEYLNTLPGTFNVIIDEYPFLKDCAPAKFVDSMFQRIVDQNLKNIRLFILGSSVSSMNEIMGGDNPLFGRFDKIIELKEWNYLEASGCYPGLSPYDKAAFYSVFGGTPYINMTLRPEKSLKENIKEQYLIDNGRARVYTESLLVTTSAQRNGIQRILEKIGNGRQKYSELKARTKMSDTELIRLLKLSSSLGLIKKDYPINKPGDDKKVRYEIADNAVRFYYALVRPNLSDLAEIGEDAFMERLIEPALESFVSYRFEDICRAYFRLKARAGELDGVLRIGRYWYDMPALKSNGEFDVVIMKKYSFDVYEAKYLSHPMTKKMIEKEIRDIREIEELNVENIGFVSVSGFDDDCAGNLISGEDLYGI